MLIGSVLFWQLDSVRLSCGMSVSDSHEILTSRLTPWHCSWASPGIPQAHPARPPGRQQHWHWRRCAQRSGWARKKRSSRKKKTQTKTIKARNNIPQEQSVQECMLCRWHRWSWTLPKQHALLSWNLRVVRGQNHCQPLHSPKSAANTGEASTGRENRGKHQRMGDLALPWKDNVN